MSAFEKVNVVSDSPEWEAERRHSVGASEVAAVMGLSPYNTPLDVWKHKAGVDKHFDPVLSYIGHASEPIVDGWVRQFSGLDIEPLPGFMARSIEYPFLHASFDRVTAAPFLTLQYKTAHHYAGHEWNEGIPTDIRVQVNAEMLVAGTPRALVVVWIGGREFRHFWEYRDERFITNHMIPALLNFWDAHVRAKVAPGPSTVAEIAEVFPSEEREISLSESAFEVLERITVLNSDITAQTEERDALKVSLAEYVGTADTLKFDGRKVATWKSQKGRIGFQRDALEAEHPEIIAQYTTVGAPFKVLRRTKEQSK